METRFPSRAVGSMTAVGCILFTMALNIAEVNRVQVNLAMRPSVRDVSLPGDAFAARVYRARCPASGFRRASLVCDSLVPCQLEKSG